jgi:predicted Rossmann fold flavoprotein
MNDSRKVVVIGGGAAGFFCAIEIAKKNPNLKIVILEKSNKVLSKVKISGGGRCNVTHYCTDLVELSKKYPRGEKFIKKAFHWFNVQDTINWFNAHDVELKVECDGRMFPLSNSSQTIIDCFLKLSKQLNIEINLLTEVKNILLNKNNFYLELNNNKHIEASFVCICSGGFQKMSQFNWLKNLQHNIISPVPSLFTFNLQKNNITDLSGISVSNVNVKIYGTKLQNNGPLLITHWGFSGPAILKLSAFAAIELANMQYNFTIQVNWLNNYNFEKLKQEFSNKRLSNPKQKITNSNSFNLPNRLWLYFLKVSEINDETIWANLITKLENNLIKTLTDQHFNVSGKTTFKEEFVTCGGIDLNEVDVNTMQSKKHENLFFAGEILNIDGITGGFNFQAAWTTAFIAAKTITEKNKMNSIN